MSKEINKVNHCDCQLLFDAGKVLVEKSGLARYDSTKFVACINREAFNDKWKDEFDPQFGRYIAWILFSVGAENLAKAACVCKKVVKSKHTPQLGDYLSSTGHFASILKKAHLYGDEKCKLLKGYERLKKVRNRDVHSYRKDRRDDDFPSVQDSFVAAFNVLVAVMRQNDHPLN